MPLVIEVTKQNLWEQENGYHQYKDARRVHYIEQNFVCTALLLITYPLNIEHCQKYALITISYRFLVLYFDGRLPSLSSRIFCANNIIRLLFQPCFEHEIVT